MFHKFWSIAKQPKMAVLLLGMIYVFTTSLSLYIWSPNMVGMAWVYLRAFVMSLTDESGIVEIVNEDGLVIWVYASTVLDKTSEYSAAFHYIIYWYVIAFTFLLTVVGGIFATRFAIYRHQKNIQAEHQHKTNNEIVDVKTLNAISRRAAKSEQANLDRKEN